jgi:predicted secreted protein
MPCKKLILLSSLSALSALSALSLALGPQARAQTQDAPRAPAANTVNTANSGGTLVVVPAFGEIRHANDEATVTFNVEEQDKDRALAAARVNQKMKQGTEIVRRADPQAELKIVNYYTIPVYPEVPDSPRPLSAQEQAARRIPIGWRVDQYLEMRTRNLDNLPKVAAAAQSVLAINGIDYHLSRELSRQLDDQQIAAAYRNLNERIASIARAMGRSVNDAVIDTVDFEGSGNYAGNAAPMMNRVMVTGSARKVEASMPEPSFEPGETTLSLRLVGKVRFR